MLGPFSCNSHILYMTKGNEMIRQTPPASYDSSVHITDFSLVDKLGDAALVGKWFVFLKAHWLHRSGMDTLLANSGISGAPKPVILFRGQTKAESCEPQPVQVFVPEKGQTDQSNNANIGASRHETAFRIQ